jgi:hypothetical protein
MSFEEWRKLGHLKPHGPSRDELEKLYRVIRRDLKAAANKKMDDDWRFAAAYNAALQCAAAALKASGYEAPKAGGAHFHTIESLKLTVGDDPPIVEQLQAFRAKRGGGIYEETDVASDHEIKTLRHLAAELFERVREYVRRVAPRIAPAEPEKGNGGKGRGGKG